MLRSNDLPLVKNNDPVVVPSRAKRAVLKLQVGSSLGGACARPRARGECEVDAGGHLF